MALDIKDPVGEKSKRELPLLPAKRYGHCGRPRRFK
jgi:hypothetical protein